MEGLARTRLGLLIVTPKLDQGDAMDWSWRSGPAPSSTTSARS